MSDWRWWTNFLSLLLTVCNVVGANPTFLFRRYGGPLTSPTKSHVFLHQYQKPFYHPYLQQQQLPLQQWPPKQPQKEIHINLLHNSHVDTDSLFPAPHDIPIVFTPPRGSSQSQYQPQQQSHFSFNRPSGHPITQPIRIKVPLQRPRQIIYPHSNVFANVASAPSSIFAQHQHPPVYTPTVPAAAHFSATNPSNNEWTPLLNWPTKPAPIDAGQFGSPDFRVKPNDQMSIFLPENKTEFLGEMKEALPSVVVINSTAYVNGTNETMSNSTVQYDTYANSTTTSTTTTTVPTTIRSTKRPRNRSTTKKPKSPQGGSGSGEANEDGPANSNDDVAGTPVEGAASDTAATAEDGPGLTQVFTQFLDELANMIEQFGPTTIPPIVDDGIEAASNAGDVASDAISSGAGSQSLSSGIGHAVGAGMTAGEAASMITGSASHGGSGAADGAAGAADSATGASETGGLPGGGVLAPPDLTGSQSSQEVVDANDLQSPYLLQHDVLQQAVPLDVLGTPLINVPNMLLPPLFNGELPLLGGVHPASLEDELQSAEPEPIPQLPLQQQLQQETVQPQQIIDNDQFSTGQPADQIVSASLNLDDQAVPVAEAEPIIDVHDHFAESAFNEFAPIISQQLPTILSDDPQKQNSNNPIESDNSPIQNDQPSIQNDQPPIQNDDPIQSPQPTVTNTNKTNSIWNATSGIGEVVPPLVNNDISAEVVEPESRKDSSTESSSTVRNYFPSQQISRRMGFSYSAINDYTKEKTKSTQKPTTTPTTTQKTIARIWTKLTPVPTPTSKTSKPAFRSISNPAFRSVSRLTFNSTTNSANYTTSRATTIATTTLSTEPTTTTTAKTTTTRLSTKPTFKPIIETTPKPTTILTTVRTSPSFTPTTTTTTTMATPLDKTTTSSTTVKPSSAEINHSEVTLVQEYAVNHDEIKDHWSSEHSIKSYSEKETGNTTTTTTTTSKPSKEKKMMS
ncbi:hypothetical protein CHUAL_006362 [Chamberlinius hualienensis]